ncbi:DUF4435 domain-containing protein [Bacillus swezeyi]|uniref:DUF4435 domain-containing protein n=1 Tax=Bacillus swezeyi TaxID=1925020 RepID=UPI0012391AAD|nr:DUF4435 domain-containing protein [Bacillus swezeyi]KAA6482230.1 DUF4435 domain-containing protein [Bacillus swezeyi]
MSAFPTRSKAAFLSEAILRYRNYDIFLFIEDEKMREVYKKLVKRLVQDKLKYVKVFSLNSKQSVLEGFNKWRKNHPSHDKCFFIVDKDFDHFRGIEIPNHPNLIELEKFTLENYLVTKEGALALLKLKVFDKEDDELEALLDWETWISDMYQGFKELFIVYAIAFKFTLEQNTSISPGRYFENGAYKIKQEEIKKYIQKIKEICYKKNINYEDEFSKIYNFYDVDGVYNYSGLIKGKYLAFGLFKYLHMKIIRKKLDEELSYYTMADNIDLEPLNFMKKKLLKELSQELVSSYISK